MTPLELESFVLSGILGRVDYVLMLLTRTAGNFAHYVTSKELKFIFTCAVESFQKYSSLLTEQYLIDALIIKGAGEEDILKYRYLFKQLCKQAPLEQDFKLAVDKLTDNFVSRCLIESMLQTQELLQRDRNGAEALDVLEKNLMILRNQVSQRDIREFSTTNLTAECALYADMKANPEKYRGIKIGIDKLDEITGGFRPGELIIAMGVTKVGKSIFLLNVQYNTMVAGYNSLYFSIEMSGEQCRRRLASRVSALPYLKIKNVGLTSEEEAKLYDDLLAFEQRATGHSTIVDVPENCTAKMIEAKIRSASRTRKIDFVIVDYLLLMSPSGQHSRLSREEKITQTALELKQMARTLGIPVITATQVASKADESKRDKDPDKVYDWVDASQAKSVSTHADWVISMKKDPDANILNLGLTVGRDGALDDIIHLVVDYNKMCIFNYVDIIPAAAPVPTPSVIFGATPF